MKITIGNNSDGFPMVVVEGDSIDAPNDIVGVYKSVRKELDKEKEE